MEHAPHSQQPTHTYIHPTAAQMFIVCALLKHFLIGKLNRNHSAEPGDKQTYTHQRRLIHSLNHHSLTEWGEPLVWCLNLFVFLSLPLSCVNTYANSMQASADTRSHFVSIKLQNHNSPLLLLLLLPPSCSPRLSAFNCDFYFIFWTKLPAECFHENQQSNSTAKKQLIRFGITIGQMHRIPRRHRHHHTNTVEYLFFHYLVLNQNEFISYEYHRAVYQIAMQPNRDWTNRPTNRWDLVGRKNMGKSFLVCMSVWASERTMKFTVWG